MNKVFIDKSLQQQLYQFNNEYSCIWYDSIITLMYKINMTWMKEVLITE